MKTQCGFTLVELMVVLIIVGILASFAIPRFSKSVYKAKAAEFPTILTAIYRAELSARDETGMFAPLAELDIDEQSIRSSNLFDYTVTSSDWASSFVAFATVKAPGFGRAKAGHKATIDHEGAKGGDTEVTGYVKTWK
jgi:prepilin-type N-terminal cleavage/methylation domain-containing protein